MVVNNDFYTFAAKTAAKDVFSGDKGDEGKVQ